MSEFVEKMNKILEVIGDSFADGDLYLSEEDSELNPSMKEFIDSLQCEYNGVFNDPDAEVFHEQPCIAVYSHPDYQEKVGIQYQYNSWNDHWLEDSFKVVNMKTRTVSYWD